MSPDEMSAPALRSALAREQTKRAAWEHEAVHLRGVLERVNGRLTQVEAQLGSLQRQYREVVAHSEALAEQNRTLQAEVVEQRAELARLRSQGPAGEQQSASARRAPSWAKAKAKAGPPGEKKPRKVREARHNTGRRRAEAAAVTAVVTHALDQCPHCQTALQGGREHRRVQVIDLPAPQPVEVTEHVLLARQCPGCHRRIVPPAPGVAAGRLGQCRFGPGVLAAITVMHTIERLPLRLIRARLARERNLHLSQGAVVGLLRRVAQQAMPRYEALRQELRTSPVVYADETGWRQAGQHGYIWTLSTPTVAFYHHNPSRSMTVPDALIGADFPGIVVSDFYVAYDHFRGPHQRCWAHLWRDIDDLQRAFPADAALATWAAGVGVIWKDATAERPAREQGTSVTARRLRSARAHRLERRLLALCPATLSPDCPHVTLAGRVRRYRDDLFTFVRHLHVSPTNNLAERSLRPLVVCRKISGGSRSDAGSLTRMVLASVLQTAVLQGEDPVQACHALLTTTPAQAP